MSIINNQEFKKHIGRSNRAWTMPSINRSSMIAKPWEKFLNNKSIAYNHKPDELEQVANKRRILLILGTLFLSFIATFLMTPNIIEQQGFNSFDIIQLTLFFTLFVWISMGFMTATMGAWVMINKDKYAISSQNIKSRKLESKTAILMTICNEDVSTVFAGLESTIKSVQNTINKNKFDFFILSDSNNKITLLEEKKMYEKLIQEFPLMNIYYRKRIIRTKKKSGNVEDFCKRWGNNYDYMIVLDADSVMTGECIEKMTILMENNENVGILQSIPKAWGNETLHARVEQFSNKLVGKLFTLGMQFWQLGESHYWGHNAIIRIKPFMEHCALALIKNNSTLSGCILSHDFVEAALMRRSGYKVMLVEDLEGSYEQQPPNLMAELQRDRRWCQGNLQNLQLITQPGLHPTHRAMFLAGAMSYIASPLWLTFILIGSVSYYLENDTTLIHQNMNTSTQWLWLFTAFMLMSPRLIGLLGVFVNQQQKEFGGTYGILKSTILETILSLLKAPLKMVAHTVFVIGAFTGYKMDWKSPPREAIDVKWNEASSFFATFTLCTFSLLIAQLFSNHSLLLWILPVTIPLLLSIPIAVLTGNIKLGIHFKENQFLLTKEEIYCPVELASLEDLKLKNQRALNENIVLLKNAL